MDKYTSPFGKLATWISLNVFSKIRWQRLQAVINGGIYYSLKEQDHDFLREALRKGYYIILTRRRCHLTTYLIQIANFIKTGRWGHYSHVLMNADDGTAFTDGKFILVEAIAKGVTPSTFMEVLDCDSVALLRPKGFTDQDWVAAVDGILDEQGKPYDTLFDLADSTHRSCVELVRAALQRSPSYLRCFPHFEEMITKSGNLTPQMFYECQDFEVVWEVRR